MKEGCLFVLFICHIKISQTMMPLATLLVPLEKPLMNMSAPRWFHNVFDLW